MLAQYGTPEEILARPADEFVARFVGADRALKRLVARAPRRPAAPGVVDGDVPSLRLPATMTARDALSTMLAHDNAEALVVDGDRELGVASVQSIAELLSRETEKA